MKGEDLEEMYVTNIIPHNDYVWCSVGNLVIRVDPKVRRYGGDRGEGKKKLIF
jgi:hypothetical protein